MRLLNPCCVYSLKENKLKKYICIHLIEDVSRYRDPQFPKFETKYSQILMFKHT